LTSIEKGSTHDMSIFPLPATEPTQNIHNVFESTDNQHSLLYIILYYVMLCYVILYYILE